MVILRRWQSSVGFPTAELFERLTTHAAPVFRPILGPSLALQVKSIGMPLPAISLTEPSDEDTFVGNAPKSVTGELYTDGCNLFAAYVTKSIDTRNPLARLRNQVTPINSSSEGLMFNLFVIAITDSLEGTTAKAFVSAVETIFEVTLRQSPFVNQKFNDLLKEDGRLPPSPTCSSHNTAARELADPNLRSLALSIRTAGGILTRDLPKQLATEVKEGADALRGRLEQHGLASSEFVVLCRKTQASIITIPSEDALMSLSHVGMKCSCGRLIAEEDVQEALAVTELCRSLLDGSKWLTLLLLEELQNVGVPLSDTLIEQQFGGDEIDCLAVISGELVLFELKDKDFNLGSAYSFVAKAGFIQPDHSVVLTTQRVGNDAREHFKRAKITRTPQRISWGREAVSNVRYFEGIGRLTVELQDLASSIYARDAQRLLGQVLSHGTLTSDDLLAWFMNRPASET